MLNRALLTVTIVVGVVGLSANAVHANCTKCSGGWCVDGVMGGFQNCWQDGELCQATKPCGEDNPDPFGPKPPIVALTLYSFGLELSLTGLSAVTTGMNSDEIRTHLAAASNVSPDRLHLRSGFQTFGDISGAPEDAVGTGPAGLVYATKRLSSGKIEVQVCAYSSASPTPVIIADQALADGESVVSSVMLAGQQSAIAFRLALLPDDANMGAAMLALQQAFNADLTAHREGPAYHFVRSVAQGTCTLP